MRDTFGCHLISLIDVRPQKETNEKKVFQRLLLPKINFNRISVFFLYFAPLVPPPPPRALILRLTLRVLYYVWHS